MFIIADNKKPNPTESLSRDFIRLWKLTEGLSRQGLPSSPGPTEGFRPFQILAKKKIDYRDTVAIEKYFKEQYIKFYFGNIPDALTSDQITQNEKFYKRKLETIMVKFALDLKDALIKEYGYNIQGNQDPSLRSKFSFRIDTSIRNVINKKYPAVSERLLKRLESEIKAEVNRLFEREKHRFALQNPQINGWYSSHKSYIRDLYSQLWNKWSKKDSYIKLSAYIVQYLGWSKYVSSESGSGRFSISRTVYKQGSSELESKSWLFENLRYLFPTKFGLPIRDALLSWFIFGDTPQPGKSIRVKRSLQGIQRFRSLKLVDLLSIDYRISKLTTTDFAQKGIEINEDELLEVQQGISYVIYRYLFGYKKSISDKTRRGIAAGRYYFTPEYTVLRAMFFAATESNNGRFLSFKQICAASGIASMNPMNSGNAYGPDTLKAFYRYLNNLFNNRPPNSDKFAFSTAKHELDRYKKIYNQRHEELSDLMGFPSAFQGDVFYFMQDMFGIPLISERRVSHAVGVTEVIVINDDGFLEHIKIYNGFKYDVYLELSKEFKEHLGLDDKWIGIAIEAQGTYWHSLDKDKERDRKKRLISKDKNVILVEIWEDVHESKWLSELIKQIKDQTGVQLSEKDFTEYKNFLGKKN